MHPATGFVICFNPATDRWVSNRFCIRITQELYDAGWNFCVDEWMKVNDNGEADTTQLFVGDVIIVTHNDDGSISGYRVAKEIFELTYSY